MTDMIGESDSQSVMQLFTVHKPTVSLQNTVCLSKSGPTGEQRAELGCYPCQCPA